MSIKTKFGLLLGSLLAVFLAVLLFLLSWDRQNLRATVTAARAEQRQMIGRWVEHATRSLESAAGEIAGAAEVRRFVLSGVPASAPLALDGAPAAFDLDALWIYDRSGTIIFTRAANLQAARPVGSELRSAARHFFSAEGENLREFAIAPIAGEGAGREDPALGWLVLTRRWDPARLLALGAAAGATVTLRETADAGSAGYSLPLIDASGRVLRELTVALPSSASIDTAESGAIQVYFFIAFSVLILAALGLALQRWILSPLARIDRSLATADAGPAAIVARQADELGRLAQLVQRSFAERLVLEREIEERRIAEAALQKSEESLAVHIAARTRLAQDLHDGIIQSLYAAGMGLTGVRAQLTAEQSKAAEQLEETRAALNETIRDVRNFITGLEPEALRAHGFRQAILALVDRVQGMQPVRAAVDIDEGVAGRLTLAQRVHALLTAREAVSNAIRHGRASEIRVSLQEEPGGIEFAIADNGAGFDPAASPAGFGLTSISARADEVGGKLTVDSAPGRGTVVRLTIPTNPHPSS